MGRHCSFPGCKNTSGLHSFPADAEVRCQWFRALGLPDRELPPRAGVCNRHFSQDCFSNLMEVNMGFSKVLILKSNAVPNIALPQDFGCTLPLKVKEEEGGGGGGTLSQHSGCALLLKVKEEEECALPQHSGCTLPLQVKEEVTPPVPTTGPPPQQQHPLLTPLRHIKPKPIREMGCQTDRVLTKHFFAQADIKPNRRSKAIQARAPNRSVSCDTDTLEAVPEVPRVNFLPVKRPRCEVSPEDSMNCTSTSGELPPRTANMYFVHEDKLMELFKRCPLCTQSCTVSKTVTGTLLQVKQSCAQCSYLHKWSSQPCEQNTSRELSNLGINVVQIE